MQIKSLFVGKLQHQTVMVTRNDYSENAFFSEISAIGCCKARQSQERYFASNAAFKASKYGRTFVNFVGEAKLATVMVTRNHYAPIIILESKVHEKVVLFFKKNLQTVIITWIVYKP